MVVRVSAGCVRVSAGGGESISWVCKSISWWWCEGIRACGVRA